MRVTGGWLSSFLFRATDMKHWRGEISVMAQVVGTATSDRGGKEEPEVFSFFFLLWPSAEPATTNWLSRKAFLLLLSFSFAFSYLFHLLMDILGSCPLSTWLAYLDFWLKFSLCFKCSLISCNQTSNYRRINLISSLTLKRSSNCQVRLVTYLTLSTSYCSMIDLVMRIVCLSQRKNSSTENLITIW